MFKKPQKSRERERERERGIVLVGLISLLFFCPNNSYSLTCSDGLVELPNILSSTFTPANGNGCQVGGYTILEIPDDVAPLFTGTLAGSVADICTSGYYSGGKCIDFEQKSCNDSYYVTNTVSSTFSATRDNECMVGGYTPQEIDDIFGYFIYNGYLLDNAETVCGAGRWSNGSCSSASQNECPDNYTDLLLDDTSFTKLNVGYCDSGYTKYTINQQCNKNTTDGMCAKLCDGDDLYTDIGTCAAICPYRTSVNYKKADGIIHSFTMYAEKQIKPSINVQFAEGQICYVNLLSGTQSGAINISYDKNTYHTVN